MSREEELDEIEETEESLEEISEEGEISEAEEEIGFTLDQINMMIQATEIWDQLLRQQISVEEAKQMLGRGVRVSEEIEKIPQVEEERISEKTKTRASKKTSRSTKSRKSKSKKKSE